MRRNAVSARDAGLELIRRINRWFVAGAVLLTGAVSVAAARSFHGHSTSSGATTARQSSGSSSSSSSASSNSSGSSSGSSLQQPAQAPSSAPVAPAPVVSSGGS